MAPFYPYIISSATSTATVLFPIATMPRPSIATNDVHTLPYPVSHNCTDHVQNGTYQVYNGTSHLHNSTYHILPPPPLGEGEPTIRPDTPVPAPTTNTTGHNYTTPPPPDSMNELPIPVDLPILPRTLNATSSGLVFTNGTNVSSGDASEIHITAGTITLFVIVSIVGLLIIVGIVTVACKRFLRKNEAVVSRRWPGTRKGV